MLLFLCFAMARCVWHFRAAVNLESISRNTEVFGSLENAGKDDIFFLQVCLFYKILNNRFKIPKFLLQISQLM